MTTRPRGAIQTSLFLLALSSCGTEVPLGSGRPSPGADASDDQIAGPRDTAPCPPSGGDACVGGVSPCIGAGGTCIATGASCAVPAPAALVNSCGDPTVMICCASGARDADASPSPDADAASADRGPPGGACVAAGGTCISAGTGCPTPGNPALLNSCGDPNVSTCCVR